MEGGPQRTSAVPLSILELQSVDEKSKSAVTKLGLLPSTVLTVQSRKKREEVGDYLGANTVSADCLRLLRTGGLHNRKHLRLRKSFLQLLSVLFPKTYATMSFSQSFCLGYGCKSLLNRYVPQFVLGYAADPMTRHRYSIENGLMDGPHVQDCHVLASTVCLHPASSLSFTRNPTHLIHPPSPRKGDENHGFSIQQQRINM